MLYRRALLGVTLVPGGLTLTAALLTGGRRLLAGTTTTGGDPAAAVTGLAALCAGLIAAWLTSCLALSVVAHAPGWLGRAAGAARDRVTPLVVRRWAAVVLGASLGASVLPGTAVAVVRTAAPDASAAPTPGWTPSSTPAPTALPGPGFTPTAVGSSGLQPVPPPAPGWVPRRPVTKQRADPHLLSGRPHVDVDQRTIVVHRGDTLWSIAATHLGPRASDLEIARAWPQWYAANASIIGEDPHLLRPGTVLSPPVAPSRSAEHTA